MGGTQGQQQFGPMPYGNPYAALGPNPYSYMQTPGWGSGGDVFANFNGGNVRSVPSFGGGYAPYGYMPTFDQTAQRAALRPQINAALNAPDGQGPNVTDIVGNVGRMNQARQLSYGPGGK